MGTNIENWMHALRTITSIIPYNYFIAYNEVHKEIKKRKERGRSHCTKLSENISLERLLQEPKDDSKKHIGLPLKKIQPFQIRKMERLKYIKDADLKTVIRLIQNNAMINDFL